MSPTHGRESDRARRTVEAVYRSDSRRVLATLIRLLGDFDWDEEALHDAFIAAAEQWPRDGVPANPRAWLVSAGRFKAIDRLRRNARFDASLGELASQLDERVDADDVWDGEDVIRFARVRPTATFVREYLPFFDQYSRSLTLWSPQGDAFTYAGRNDDGDTGIWVQPVEADRPAVRVSDGQFASWSPR